MQTSSLTQSQNTFSQARLVGHALRVANVCLSQYFERPPAYLPILLIFITDKCNLQCPMCGVWERHGSGSSKELSTEEWKVVIRSAVKLRTAIISITGGESLVRHDLFEIIRYAHEREIAVHLCSNGTVLDHDSADRLRESGVNTVSISLESNVPEIHDSLRGKGSFQRAIRGIRLLRKQAPTVKIGINYLITAQNFKNMQAMIPFAERLGVHQIKFQPIHTNLQHKGKRLEEFNHLIFKEETLDELQAEISGLARAMDASSLQTTSASFLAGITDLYRKPQKFRCYAGYVACAINPVGMVTPCCDMEGKLSVRDMPLEEIWRNDKFHKLRGCVKLCDKACWDTTNAELSLRLSTKGLLGGISQTIHDLKFYFGGNKR